MLLPITARSGLGTRLGVTSIVILVSPRTMGSSWVGMQLRRGAREGLADAVVYGHAMVPRS